MANLDLRVGMPVCITKFKSCKRERVLLSRTSLSSWRMACKIALLSKGGYEDSGRDHREACIKNLGADGPSSIKSRYPRLWAI